MGSILLMLYLFCLNPALLAAPTLVLVVGAEGTPEYGRDFSAWADRWADAAQRAPAKLVQIGRDSFDEANPDRQRLQEALAAEAMEPSEPLWIVLIGHGTFDSREAKFNLRGTDISDIELAEWLTPVRRPIALINCASGSAPFLNRVSGPNRIVVTATRSGHEQNFARFGDHLSAAIADPAADLDKDGQTSLLEAFLAASHRTQEFYKADARLATEHALLDDNGDKLGVGADWFSGTRATRSAKEGATVDGPRAHQWHLLLSPTEAAMPAELRAERDALELQIETHRNRKSTLSEGDYYAQLESLLLKLAPLYADSPSGAAPAPPAAP